MTYISKLSNFKHAKDRELIGGKASGIKLISKLGMSVPPGFVLTTKVWDHFNKTGKLSISIRQKIQSNVRYIEKSLLRSFSANENSVPLLFSVRSGSKYSMPGMMDTILNVGLNKKKLKGLSIFLKGENFAFDTYRRFIKMYASSVYSIHQGEFDIVDEMVSPSGNFTIAENQDLIERYRKIIFKLTRQEIPEDPFEQLEQAIIAVLNSWDNPGAVAFRQINGIPDNIGTAVIVQSMVFGNTKNSGTGVLFTRNTETGGRSMTGDYLEDAQGEDIVRGTALKKTISITRFAKKYKKEAKQLFSFAEQLEKYYKDVQDIEFTIEHGQIWLLQTRSAKRTPLANVRIAKMFFEEGLISEKSALRRVKPSDIEFLTKPSFNREVESKARESKLLSKGEPASSGVATGILALNTRDVVDFYRQGKNIILVCDHIDPNDVDTLTKISGVVTTKGSSSSHMAIIIRSLGLPGIVGCKEIQLLSNSIISRNHKILKGQEISINALSGDIYSGKIEKEKTKKIESDLREFISRRISRYGTSPWTSALYVERDAPSFLKVKQKVNRINKKAQTKWKSQKAQVIEILNQIFSEKVMIPSTVIDPKDINSLRWALTNVIQKGFKNAPRTCHHPEKLAGAPWSDGPNSIKEIDNFLFKPNYPGKYGGYRKWIEDKTLNAIVVSQEPENKLNPKYASEHFVCTVTCLNTNPASVVINVNLGTAQLRSLEQVEATNLVIIKATLDSKFDYMLGDKSYQFGMEMLDKQKIKKVLSALKRNNELKDRQLRHLLKQINANFPEVKFNKITFVELKEVLVELMVRNSLPDDLYQLIISDKNLKILEQISKKIFIEWWQPKICLPYYLAALDNLLGLSVLEVQGRFSKNGNLMWMRVYGAKGAEERIKISHWESTKK